MIFTKIFDRYIYICMIQFLTIYTGRKSYIIYHSSFFIYHISYFIYHISNIKYHIISYLHIHYITSHCSTFHSITWHYIALYYITIHTYIHACMHAYIHIPVYIYFNPIDIDISNDQNISIHAEFQRWKWDDYFRAKRFDHSSNSTVPGLFNEVWSLGKASGAGKSGHNCPNIPNRTINGW